MGSLWFEASTAACSNMSYRLNSPSSTPRARRRTSRRHRGFGPVEQPCPALEQVGPRIDDVHAQGRTKPWRSDALLHEGPGLILKVRHDPNPERADTPAFSH